MRRDTWVVLCAIVFSAILIKVTPLMIILSAGTDNPTVFLLAYGIISALNGLFIGLLLKVDIFKNTVIALIFLTIFTQLGVVPSSMVGLSSILIYGGIILIPGILTALIVKLFKKPSPELP